jgi:hypothetical protein
MARDSQPLLQPREFACIGHGNTLLYTEIIQVVEKRQRYWARPVLLCESVALADHDAGVMRNVYDVRFGSDLLWPRPFFRCVFDSELIPLLTYLTPDAIAAEGNVSPWLNRITLARQKLHQFAQQLWQAYPSAFQEEGLDVISSVY